MARHKDERPAAERIANSIRVLIMSGEWEPGVKLPTTAQLIETYGASNVTIQRALKILKDEELLTGRSGSGVYVRERTPHVVTPASYLTPGTGEEPHRWTVDASNRSQRQSNRILNVCEVTPPKRVVHALGERTAILRKRLGLTEGEPTEVTCSYYPMSWARGTELAERRKIRGGAPRILSEMGRAPRRQEDEVAARAATTEEYELLQIPGAVPVLEVFRIMRDGNGEPVEVTEMVKPAHLYKLGYRLSM